MNWNGIISLLFFCIESILLVNMLYFSKYRRSNTGIYVIGLLAGYQLLEFLMCGLNLQQPVFPFLAFTDISFLPPLGLIFTLELLGKKIPSKIYFFIPAGLFIIYFLFTVDRFAVVSCTVLYASFHYPGGPLYGICYYLPILLSVILLFSGLKNHPGGKRDIIILLSGNLFIAVPVITAFIFYLAGNDFLLRIIESVMCKAALMLAICYSLVMLNTGRQKRSE